MLAGAQKEKAAHIVLEELEKGGVTVRNYGQTPVTRVIVTVKAQIDEDGGPDVGWLTVGEVRGHGVPLKKDLLPAGETAPFTFGWEEKWIDPSLRWQDPEVTFEYTDAAGTRWRRTRFDLPVRVGGTPLPGSAAEARRAKRHSRSRWLKRHLGNIRKSVQLGFQRKGFTRKGRAKWRDKQREKAQQAEQD